MDDKSKIELLKAEIIKRDELIYGLMFNNSHMYQSFMLEKSDKIIDKLHHLEFSKLEYRKSALDKQEQMHKELFNKIEQYGKESSG